MQILVHRQNSDLEESFRTPALNESDWIWCTGIGRESSWKVGSKEYVLVHLEGKRGEGGCFFTQIEPNWPLPYSTVPVPWLRDARLAGWVTSCEYNAESQKQDRKRFNSIVKTIGFDHLVIIYLWLDPSNTDPSSSLHQLEMLFLSQFG